MPCNTKEVYFSGMILLEIFIIAALSDFSVLDPAMHFIAYGRHFFTLERACAPVAENERYYRLLFDIYATRHECDVEKEYQRPRVIF